MKRQDEILDLLNRSSSKESISKSNQLVGESKSSRMRNTSEVSKDVRLKHDLLHVAIVDVYLNLKRQINKYNKKGLQE